MLLVTEILARDVTLLTLGPLQGLGLTANGSEQSHWLGRQCKNQEQDFNKNCLGLPVIG